MAKILRQLTRALCQPPRETIDCRGLEAASESRNAAQTGIEPAPRAVHESQSQYALVRHQGSLPQSGSKFVHQSMRFSATSRPFERNYAHGMNTKRGICPSSRPAWAVKPRAGSPMHASDMACSTARVRARQASLSDKALAMIS